MFSAFQSFSVGASSAPALPRIMQLSALYALGVDLPRGEVIMIAGRSGSQKSGFALFLIWSLRLPTLYLAADMSARTVAYRLAAMATGQPIRDIAASVQADPEARERYAATLADAPLTFSYDSPITWEGLAITLDAYVETWDAYPEVIVIDNLMDIQGASAEYAEQMEAMQGCTELAQQLGATVFVLHHATDKGQSRRDPWSPPTRAEVKGGLSEKPSLSLSVSLQPDTNAFRVAAIKNRHGKSDPMAENHASLYADPERNRFYSSPVVPGMADSFTREP
jgi:hypothetical protein